MFSEERKVTLNVTFLDLRVNEHEHQTRTFERIKLGFERTHNSKNVIRPTRKRISTQKRPFSSKYTDFVCISEKVAVLTPTRKGCFGLETEFLVWNRFEQVKTRILTFKFELKSHFIIFSKSKNVKIPPTSPSGIRSFRISFLQNNKIDQNLEFKIRKIGFSKISNLSGKFQKWQSSFSIRQQIRFCTALSAKILFYNKSRISSHQVVHFVDPIQTVIVIAVVVVIRGCVRLNFVRLVRVEWELVRLKFESYRVD